MHYQSSRYPLYLSVFDDIKNDVMQENHSILPTNQTEEVEPIFNSDLNYQQSNSKIMPEPVKKSVEPGGFLVTPIDLDENPLEFEQGFEYTLIDPIEFIDIFNELRDTNADVRIPDPYEGFGYSFIEKFGQIDPNSNKPPGRRGGNSRGRGARGARGGRGGNNRGGRGGRGGGRNQNNNSGSFNPRGGGNPFNRGGH